jgi:translocation and assembly module TamB
MRKILRIIGYSLALIFVIVTAILSFLISTNTGLYTSLQIANWMMPGKLTVKKATGTLVSNWQLTQVAYQSPQTTITLDNLKVNWRVLPLLRGHLVIKNAILGQLSIQHKVTKAADSQSQPESHAFKQSLQLPLAITIDTLSIKQVRFNKNTYDNIHMSVQLDSSNWLIKQLSLQTQQSQFKLAGHLNQHLNYKASLTLKATSLKAKGFSGEFKITGDWADYRWQGITHAPIALLTSGHLKEGATLNGDVKWQAFSLPGQHKTPILVTEGQLKIQGDADKLSFSLDTGLDKPIQTKINASGFHTPQHNEAMIKIKPDQGDFILQILQDQEKNQTKTTLNIKGNQIDLTPFHYPLSQLTIQGQVFGSKKSDLVGDLTIKGLYHQKPLSLSIHKSSQRIRGEINLANNQIHFTGQNPFPLTIRGTLPSPQFIAPSLEGLNTIIHINGTFNSPTDGNARISVQSGQYIHPTELTLPPLSFIGGNYTLTLSSRGLHLNGQLAIDPQKTLLTKLSLPHFSLFSDNSQQQRISGKIALNLNSLDFVSQLTPHIVEANGRLTAQLNIRGRLAKPQIRGRIDLHQGSFKTTTSDTPFQPVTLSLSTSANHWQIQGGIHHEGSQLSLSGSGRFTPQFNGNMRIAGNNFLAINSKEYQVYLSPAIAINLSPDKTEISGEITIPKARIQPHTFSSTVTLSDDVVFSDQQEDDFASMPFRLELMVKMGDDVRLLIEGLSAKIIGAVRLQKLSGGMLISSGQLSVADGQYEAYGQKLAISQGELLFAGGAITNPGINIRATRTFNTTGQAFSGSNRLFDFGASNIQSMSFSNVTTVGVQVSGRLSNPKVSLFSEPSNLQQSDILSMLLLGRPASQASSAGGQLLLSAITNMGLDGKKQGGQLFSQLQDKLGLEFGVDSNSTYNQQQGEVTSTHSLGVKKKFSDRLSLGYNTGIYDSNSTVLTLTYLLNRFFSIQVNASDTSSGLDFTYTRSKD